MPSKIKAWSYSRYAVYAKCPRQFKLKFIDKLPEPQKNWAADRGTILHAKAESFILGRIKGMPKELKPFSSELKYLRDSMADVEVDLSVTRAWEPTHTKDWDRVWCRAFLDVKLLEDKELTVVDHKTGKIYDSHEEQGELYGVTAMCHEPKAEVVDVEMWYYDQGAEVLSWKYYRKDLEKLKKKWEDKVKPIFRDTKFAPCPGAHCRWCNFSKKAGGPCEYS